MRVLITGAGGFIGRHLVRDQLRNGHFVTAVDLDTSSLAPLASEPRLSVLQGDFADHDLINRHLPNQDVCFHLAAAHLETSKGDDFYWDVNTRDTFEFAVRCHQNQVGRFVLCSSVGVFGPQDQLPVDENTPCQPNIIYEKSKLAGEQKVLAYAKETGFAVVVVRPAWVYGPGCQRTGRLIRSIQKKRFFFVGNGKTMRHPIYVGDVLEGFNEVATNPKALGDTFIIAGPKAVSLIELTAEIARATKAPPPQIRLPFSVVWLGCVFFEGVERLTNKEMPFSRRSLKFYTDSSAFSTDKAREVLGFEANTNLTEGLVKTLTWINNPLEAVE